MSLTDASARISLTREILLANLVPNEAPTPEVLFEPPLAVEPEPTLRVQAEDDSPEAEELLGPATPPKTVTEEYIPTPQKEVRFRVSSKHLTLASSTFKIMLNGQWGEASKLEITAEDWNTEAMLILMSVIHGQNQQVPKVISLEILTNIAILVDYYECREAIDLAAEIWINKLTQPKEPSRDLVFWLFISWVFRREEVFRAMTTVALRQSKGPLQALNLPIPERIIGEYRKASDQLTENSLAFSELIDRLRCEFIGDILASLKELGSDLLQGKAGCSSACSSMMLGSLLREMNTRGLETQPGSQLTGVSFVSSMEAALEIRSPCWATKETAFGTYFREDPCNLTHMIKGKVGFEQVNGFGLTEADKGWRKLKKKLVIRDDTERQ